MTALEIAGVAGAAKVVDKVGTGENVGKAGESTTKAIAREIGKVEVPTGIKVEQLSASNGTRFVHTSIDKTQIKDIAQKFAVKKDDSAGGSGAKGTGKVYPTRQIDTVVEAHISVLLYKH
jgi:hypothetical protein